MSRPLVRKLFWISLVAFVALVWFGSLGRVDLREPEDAPSAEGWSLLDLQGGRVEFDELRGDVVLVNLWASWCAPCRRELPDLVDLHDRYRDRGLVVLGVNVDEVPREQVPRLAERFGIPYPVLVPNGPPDGPFRTPGVIPHTWLIDREGRVRASHSGIVSKASIEEAVLALLAAS